MGGRTEVDLTQLRSVADHVMRRQTSSLRCVGQHWIPLTCKAQPSVASPHRILSPHASPTSSRTCVVGRWLRICQPTRLSVPTIATATCSARGDATDCLTSRSVAAGFTASARRCMGCGGPRPGGACRLRHAGSPPQQRILDRRHGRCGSGQRATHCGSLRLRGEASCHRVGRCTRRRRSDRRGSHVVAGAAR